MRNGFIGVLIVSLILGSSAAFAKSISEGDYLGVTSFGDRYSSECDPSCATAYAMPGIGKLMVSWGSTGILSVRVIEEDVGALLSTVAGQGYSTRRDTAYVAHTTDARECRSDCSAIIDVGEIGRILIWRDSSGQLHFALPFPYDNLAQLTESIVAGGQQDSPVAAVQNTNYFNNLPTCAPTYSGNDDLYASCKDIDGVHQTSSGTVVVVWVVYDANGEIDSIWVFENGRLVYCSNCQQPR